MPGLTSLSFELIVLIGQYLSFKELICFSQCNRAFYGLQSMEDLWKRLCRVEFGIAYTYPKLSSRQLFKSCCLIVKGKGKFKRLPCSHVLDIDYLKDVQKLDQCQRCIVHGAENLFLCISDHCHQTLCDRHTRQHAKLAHPYHHSVFYKLNTSELFCQVCVDWIGGLDSHPIEQYIASKITLKWIHQFKEDLTILDTRKYRQMERLLRWKDTPQNIMKSEFCFISSRWMIEWEMFVEGWRTQRPFTIIDQSQLLSLVIGLNREGTNPFYLHSNDSVMIISKETWDYLYCHYNVKGKKITEKDLTPVENYSSIIQRIDYWKRRALNR